MKKDYDFLIHQTIGDEDKLKADGAMTDIIWNKINSVRKKRNFLYLEKALDIAMYVLQKSLSMPKYHLALKKINIVFETISPAMLSNLKHFFEETSADYQNRLMENIVIETGDDMSLEYWVYCNKNFVCSVPLSLVETQGNTESIVDKACEPLMTKVTSFPPI